MEDDNSPDNRKKDDHDNLNLSILKAHWQPVYHKYEVLSILGTGSYR
jgi:ubiquitin-protein ligase